MSSSKSRAKNRRKSSASGAPSQTTKAPVASSPLGDSPGGASSKVAEVSVQAPSREISSPATETAGTTLAPLSPAPSDWFWMGALAVMVIAIALRQVQLASTPSFYPDENIHAWFSQGFAGYSYNPTFHGPLLYHLVSATFALFGQYDYTARLVPSLLGIGLIALVLGPARRWMGERPALFAAGLLAISPSIVTYSRILFHDALVLDLTLGAVLCFITALHHPPSEKRGRWALFGLSALLSLFLATKANFFFILVVIVAFWLTWQFPRRLAPALLLSVAAAALLWKSSLWASLLAALGSLSHLPASWAGPVCSGVLLLSVAVPAFYLAWRFLPSLPPISGFVWPLAGFAVVTVAAIVFPRDNSFSDAEKASQHLGFQLVALGSCAMVWGWLWSRRPTEEETQSHARWKKGNDWATWVLALALAVWIYVLLFGQGAQIIGQWVSTRHFPVEAFASGRAHAQSAIFKMLEYWGGQQAHPRLASRHDYYMVLGILYELPLLLAAIGGIWHAARNRSVWTDFLLWWAFASWTVYAVANEKVPWLLVHILLPLALLGGTWLASLDWKWHRSSDMERVKSASPSLASARWKRPLLWTSTVLGVLFLLRGDAAMIFGRAGDNAEPLLYAQTPDSFREAVQAALVRTRGDSRSVWINTERQWPSWWYLREKDNPPMGQSKVALGGAFEPEKYRAFIAMDADLAKWTSPDRGKWNLQTVNFFVWPRASWKGLQPPRFWRWFWTRETIAPSERDGAGPANSPTSILAGQGEWSYQTTTIGSLGAG